MYSLPALTRRRQARHTPRPTAPRSRVPLLEALEDRCLLASYFVSPTGNDSNIGTSTLTPWQTISRVNQQAFAAGDIISFQGGASFSGGLTFADEAGTPTSPITITSYGTGRATILAGLDNGIFVYNTGGFSISNLNIVGAGLSVNLVTGILLYNDLPGGVELQYFRVDNVEVSEFGYFGIWILGCNGNSGFNDIRITNAKLHHNLYGGLSSVGPLYCYGDLDGNPATPPNPQSDARVIRNVTVRYLEVYNNPGLPPALSGSSGSGIILASINTGIIERCLAHDNGIPGTGNVGIWLYNSNNITIQYNESYRNRSGGDGEGGGFDFDFDVTDSIMQYNYSHDNDGQGFYIVGIGPHDPIFFPPPWRGDITSRRNVIRYNISQNDARKNLSGGLVIYGGVYDSEFYNNTVYMTPNSTADGASAVLFGNFYGRNVNFRNNIFQTTGNAYLIRTAGSLIATGARFQGNDYWTSGTLFIYYGAAYNTLAAWRSARQEKVGNTPVGLNVDPLLTNPGLGGTIGDADLLYTLSAYKLKQSGSLLKNAGLNLLAQFGVNPGPIDFYGDPIPDGGYSIGAHDA